jgi:hypothetical protein
MLSDAFFTKKIIDHCPSLPAKVSKVLIRVNPIAYSHCGE